MDQIYLIAETAKNNIKNNTTQDLNNNKIDILFPFFEQVLDYAVDVPGEVLTAPVYKKDGSYKIDYGLSDVNNDIFKCFFKVVPYGKPLDNELNNIIDCMAIANPIAQFVVITDCYKYDVYTYDPTKINLIKVGTWDLTDLSNFDPQIINLLKKEGPNIPKQEYAVNDNEMPEQNIDDKLSMSTNINDSNDTNDTNNKKPRSKIIKIAIIVISILLILIIIFPLNKKNNNGLFSNIPLIGTQNTINKNELFGTLNVSIATSANNLNINLNGTNIPCGGIVKFEIINNKNKDVCYGTVDNNNNIQTIYNIPSTWDNPKITINAYLKFDDANHIQPNIIKEKFGVAGENIIEKEDKKDKFLITTKMINYDSEAVKKKLAQDLKNKEEQEKNKIKNDWNSISVRIDSIGNWKIIPKGFDMNNVNISESRNIYPQIFYNAHEKQASFYLVCGTINQLQTIRFTNVVFYADGYQWNYDVNSNSHKFDITGGAAKEWVYFNNFDTTTLLNDAKLLGNAELSKITFKGDKIKEHVLSKNEKDDIIKMLYMYATYFNNGNSVPKKSWVDIAQSINSEMKLNFIQKPTTMLERDSNEENNIAALQNEIQEGRNKDGTVDSTKQINLNLLNSQYKILSDKIKDELYTSIINSSSKIVNTPDFTNAQYYKIYFKYNQNNTMIENGYIPYLYIDMNKNVYIPIKTDNNNSNINTYASYSIDNYIFDNILAYISNTTYTKTS